MLGEVLRVYLESVAAFWVALAGSGFWKLILIGLAIWWLFFRRGRCCCCCRVCGCRCGCCRCDGDEDDIQVVEVEVEVDEEKKKEK